MSWKRITDGAPSGDLGVGDRLQRRRGELVAGGDERVDEAALLAEAHDVAGDRGTCRSRGLRRLAEQVAEAHVGVGGADARRRARRRRAARSARRATTPSPGGAGAVEQLEARGTAGRSGRARRGRRARCWRSPRSCPRGPAAWPRRAGRGAARRARTRGGCAARTRSAISVPAEAGQPERADGDLAGDQQRREAEQPRHGRRRASGPSPVTRRVALGGTRGAGASD